MPDKAILLTAGILRGVRLFSGAGGADFSFLFNKISGGVRFLRGVFDSLFCDRSFICSAPPRPFVRGMFRLKRIKRV